MTIGDLLRLYHAYHLSGKPSAPYYGRLIRQVFTPLIEYPVDHIPFPVMLDWWKSLWDRPGHANKALGLYRASHRWAMGLGQIATPDQTAGLVKREEQTRSQTTTPEEWSRLVVLLEDIKLRHRVYFWSLYLLGSRPGEVRTMRPAHLSIDGDCPRWTKPTSKNRRPHVVPIPEQLVPLLRLLKRSNHHEAQWMFWGQHPGRVWGRTSAQKMWEGLRAKAGLSHLWLNDLRRSTASDLLNQGENLGVVQSALNHRSLSQTAKYAYLAVGPLSRALQERTDWITKHM